MLRRTRSQFVLHDDGSVRAMLTRRDAGTLRYALTGAAVRDGDARDTLAHVEHWGSYSGAAPVIVVPLPREHLCTVRAALREYIGMLPVSSTTKARRLYHALLSPTPRKDLGRRRRRHRRRR